MWWDAVMILMPFGPSEVVFARVTLEEIVGY